MNNKKIPGYLLTIALCLTLLFGCGSRDEPETDALPKQETAAKSGHEADSKTEKTSVTEPWQEEEAAEEEAEEEEAADDISNDGGDASEDEEYVEYEADELCDIFREMSVEEAAVKYAITLVDGGKYADYEGDIGDVISEYKNRDIDGDGELYKYNSFSVVSRVYEINRGSGMRYLCVDFDIYSLNEDDYDAHGIGRDQYSLSAEEALELAAENRLIHRAYGSAILDRDADTASGYGLLHYSIK